MGADLNAASELVTSCKVSYFDSSEAGRLAILTLDNGADHRKPNTFGEQGLASLLAAVEEVGGQSDVKGLLLTGKPFVFAAGADLGGFEGMDEARAREAARRGHEAFGRLRDLPFPTLAAINGVCMGGGLELALHCDYRTLSASAAGVAFPEVFLSIVPAWGGTQLTPRVAGFANALIVIVGNPLNSNRVLRAARAAQLGLTDRLLPATDFFEESLATLEGLVTGRLPLPAREPSTDGLDEALATARRAADDRVHGATRAPYVAIDLIEFAARGGDLAEGLRREEQALAELLPARQAQAAVYSFGLTQQRVKRQPWKPATASRRIAKVGIVGAGLMGAQLGALFLQRFEVPLVLTDIDAGVLEQARRHIDGELDARVAKGRLRPGKADHLKSSVTTSTDVADHAGADFVLEAVAEDLGLKQRIFADLEASVDAGCVLATNTSGLSVTAMAAGLLHPERVVGLHFFNPVAVLPLVEVVRTKATSDEALATAFAVATTLRKSAVPCADTPGFVVNRLLTRFMGACGQAVNQGSGFTEVDDAIKELGLPMGPFELLGLVGPAVAAHVARTLHEAYPDRFALDNNFQMLGSSGVPGVYDWSNGRVPYSEVTERWQVSAAGGQRMTAAEIRDSAVEAVADEIAVMLDEGVVADARDIDTCLLLGAGWPFFLGGICKYLDQTGVSQTRFGRTLVSATDHAATRPEPGMPLGASGDPLLAARADEHLAGFGEE
ncbi:MAG: enoyl-CoA hydratase/isomerase family protein [Euzebyaceae bacterium]|nr:enoyl-CoA hydratase/isomerase family protein [Euzebyaceae bacterium]